MKLFKKIGLIISVLLYSQLLNAQVNVPNGLSGIGTSGSGNIEFVHNVGSGGLQLLRNNSTTFRSQISFRQYSPNTEKFALGIDWSNNKTNDFFISQVGSLTTAPRFYIGSTGKIGINTSNITSSSTLVTIEGGDLTIIESPGSSPYNVDGNSPDIYLRDQFGGILNLSSNTNVGRIDAVNSNSNLLQLNKWGGNVIIGMPVTSPAPASGPYVFSMPGNATINGSLVVGNPANFTATVPFPTGYSLYVDKGILTEKLKVAIKTTTDWSDYVFSTNYKLMPLDSVETYVKENKHLPDVPSAQEVVDNGIDVAKMDATLLQKIEELTLYMIELEKNNQLLKKRIELLEENQNSNR